MLPRCSPAVSSRLAGWSIVVVFRADRAALLARCGAPGRRSSTRRTRCAVGAADAASRRCAPSSPTSTASEQRRSRRDPRRARRRRPALPSRLIEGRPFQVLAAAARRPAVAPPTCSPRAPVRLPDRRGRRPAAHGAARAARMKAGGGSPRFLIEVEPIQARQLRRSGEPDPRGRRAGRRGAARRRVRADPPRSPPPGQCHGARARAPAREPGRDCRPCSPTRSRNPLASLKGKRPAARAHVARGDKPRAKADRVVDEAVRLEQLTNDLLQFVRTGTIERTASTLRPWSRRRRSGRRRHHDRHQPRTGELVARRRRSARS